MSKKFMRPGLTAAMTAGRALLAAGWRVDTISRLADRSTERSMFHPSGREIIARTDRHGDYTALTLGGLSLDQVAGAITGAGLTEPAPAIDEEPPTPRSELAAALRRLADDIEHHELPVPAYKLHVGGCVESRADVQRWADHMGVAIRMGGTDDDIPVASRGIRVTDRLDLEVSFQGPAEPVATEDRHCRSCGATSGLRLLTSSPLELAAWEWECTDSFACGAR